MSQRNSWTELFDEYQRIVVGIAGLLRDTDRLMAQRGYTSAHALNTVGSEASLHVEQPERWTPGWFVRFYKTDAKPDIMPYVAVFLHDRRGLEDYKMPQEPLVVAGLIRSATGDACKWYYWHCKQWFWTDGHEVDGPPATATFESSKEGQASNTSFAVRLERIGQLSDLERLVIEPLIRLQT